MLKSFRTQGSADSRDLLGWNARTCPQSGSVILPYLKNDFVILIAEDNADDLALVTQALSEIPMVNLQITRDGVDVIRYLQGAGEFADRSQYPMPDLLMLDLKMPELGGMEVLRWLKDHSECRLIAKIILSGSNVEKDVEEAYQLGVNAFFTKPGSFHELQELMRLVVGYWSRSQRPFTPRNCGTIATEIAG